MTRRSRGLDESGSSAHTASVYPPSEDTELLLAAVAKEDSLAGERALDLGTGSGAVGIALQAAGARVVAVDINPSATAQAHRLGLATVRADLTSALRGPFDIVAFNAPYLPSSDEERLEGDIDRAFHGGEGGVEVSARFVADLPRVLAADGRAFLVVSSRADLDALAAAVDRAGLRLAKVASARFFFEEVAVWRLTHASGGSRRPA